MNRFTEDGFEGLEDQSRQPRASPNHLEKAAVCKIVRLKKDHPRRGPKKIHAPYLNRANDAISLSSVKRVLRAPPKKRVCPGKKTQ